MDKKTFRINKLFSENFNNMGNVKTTSPVATNAKAPMNVGKKKPPIIQHTKFTDENMSERDFSALKKKSEVSGIDLEILGEVFDRGIDAWTEDNHLTPQQYAFNRVNSFVNEGRAFKEDDADLAEQVRTFGRRKEDNGSSFSNWKFDIGVGQRTKVLSGDHKGKRGEVLGKIDHKDGPVYRIKHDDGTIMKHHISTLEEPEDRRKVGLGTRRVSEEAEPINEVSAKTLQSYLNKSQSHWVQYNAQAKHAQTKDERDQGAKNRTKRNRGMVQAYDKLDAASGRTTEKPVKVPATMHEDLDEARPVNNPHYDHSEKMWDERKKAWEKREKEKNKKDLDESSNKPYIKPHYGDGNNPNKQTAWKANNKHGKVKYFGLDFKSAASKHAGIVEESAMTHEELIKEMEKYDRVMDKFGGKLMFTNHKHKGQPLSGYVVGHDPEKDDHVKLRVDTASGVRRSGYNKTEDHSVHQDHLSDKYVEWNALEEGKMSELDYDIKNLDNGNFKKKYGKHKETVRSNLSNKPVTEEDLSDPADREQGTDTLVNIYKQMTPGQQAEIDSAFTQVFKEQVVSADRKPVIVRPFKKEITDPETGERHTVDIKAHSKTAPARKVIIKSGNISDGKTAV